MTEQKKAKILIMDDVETIVECYKMILDENKFEISEANSGKKAMEIIDRGNKFDLIISDIVMPVERDELTLADCQETGVRLLSRAIENETSSKVYVITVRKDLQSQIETMCRDHGVKVRFESRLEHKPEKFKQNVEALISL